MTQGQTFALEIGWKPLLKDLGIQPEVVLKRAGLPTDLLSRSGQRLSTDEYFRFWLALEQEAKNPYFGLQIVESFSAESFDPPIFAALCSANLMQAVQRLSKYKQLMAPMSLDIDVAANGELTLSPRWLYTQREIPFSLQVAEIAFFVRLAQLATREPIKAIQVTLSLVPEKSHARRYTEFFGTPIQLGVNPQISFSAIDALRPFLTVNENMWQVFEPDLRRRLNELDATATTTQRVQALLLELIPSNIATIDEVADRLAMSKRTLQRRLENEGENFRTLLNETREKLARHYLKETSLSGGEIAFLLGFEDPNSFYRAFQDWTGQTPVHTRHNIHLN
jgi:AraC-type DNA-binding domain-containing proteins